MRISDWSSDVCSSDLNTEVIDVAATEQGPERLADILHRQAKRRDLVTLHVDRDLRLVELQVGVDEVELAAVARLVEDAQQHVVEVCERLRRPQHKHHWRVVAADRKSTRLNSSH